MQDIDLRRFNVPVTKLRMFNGTCATQLDSNPMSTLQSSMAVGSSAAVRAILGPPLNVSEKPVPSDKKLATWLKQHNPVHEHMQV